VTFSDNGTIIANGKNAFPIPQSWVPDEWYDVKLIVDRQSKVFSVWVNGTLESQNLQGCDDPYDYEGFALRGRYAQTTDNFDDVNIFEATVSADNLSNINIKGTYTVEIQ
jgi:hypothetical protein